MLRENVLCNINQYIFAGIKSLTYLAWAKQTNKKKPTFCALIYKVIRLPYAVIYVSLVPESLKISG